MGHDVEPDADSFGDGLGRDRAYRHGHHLAGVLTGRGEVVAQEMNSASLVGGAEQNPADGFDQAGVTVGDEQTGAGQAASAQQAQELASEHLGLTVARRRPKYFAPPCLVMPVVTTA